MKSSITMLMFNKQIWESLSWAGVTRGVMSYDPFAELLARPRVEVALQDGKLLIYPRQSLRPGEKLAGAPHVLNGTDMGQHESSLASKVVLSVPEAETLSFVLEIPARAQVHLPEMVLLELSRVTPFLAEDIYWSWFLDARSAAQPKHSYRILVVNKSRVEPSLAEIAAAGGMVIGLVVRDRERRLLPLVLGINEPQFGATTIHRLRLVAAGGIVLAAVAAFALFFSINSYYSEVSEKLETQLQLTGKKAKAVRDAIAKAETKKQTINREKTAETDSTKRLQLLEQLSRILPPDSYLTGLNIDGNKVTLEGLSGQPENLGSLLEKSGAVQEVGFSAPILKAPGETVSHLSLKFSLPGADK